MTLDELDRLAAEKVMGMQELSAKDFIPVPNDGKLYFTKLHAPECCPEPWQPTRNIAQAWECLEKINGFDVSVGGSFLGWRCNIYSQKEFEEDFGPGGHGKATFEYCDSAALAIVRACLKAKGVEI